MSALLLAADDGIRWTDPVAGSVNFPRCVEHGVDTADWDDTRGAVQQAPYEYVPATSDSVLHSAR